MNEQTGASRIVDRSDPKLRRRRLDALQQAHQAKRILEHEAEMAARYGAAGVDPAAPRTRTGTGTGTGTGEEGRGEAGTGGGDGGPSAGAVHDVDIARLRAIHRDLQHERKAARRPFHRHADRLVLALELAERLALERLGFDDYADFEAHGGAPRPGRDIIDLATIESAEQQLAEAEATLAELDALEGVEPSTGRTRPWVAPHATSRLPFGPVARTGGRTRPTRARRDVFDPPTRGAAASTVAEPTAIGPTAVDRDRLQPEAEIVPPVTPLPVRRPGTRTAGADEPRSIDERDLADDPALDLTEPGEDVLGVIVRDGRTIRVEKAPGVPYADADDPDGSGLRPDSITYGDPRRLI